ncbi:MAG: GNAT family N-acetyltransferase [Candidatus Thermoplasmatota archaeon]
MEELHIRNFKDPDYSELVRLEEAVYPDKKHSEESFRFRDENRADKCEHQRFIAGLDGQVIGHGFYTQWEGSYQPGKFFIYALIHPDYQAEGYGKRFHHFLLEELEEHDPKKLEAHAREDKERAVRFLEDRGFEQTMKMWEAELMVDEFDFDEYEGLEKKLEYEGIVLTTLEEIEHDKENKRKLYELHEDVMEDVPMPDEYTRTDYDRFIDGLFNHPRYFPEGYILAVKEDEFVGMSSHWLKEKENSLFTGLTGVRKDHRGKGIATAMKVKAVEVAKEENIDKIKTMNETRNEDILHINEKMGFERKLGWVDFEKEVGEDN